MIRFFDFTLSLIGLLILWPIGIIIYILCLFDTGSPIFIQKRVGKKLKPFNLYKFRTMHINTETKPSHLADGNSVTKFGRFLRKSKLDEYPQLINVLKGEMSLVGPRPVILLQKDIIEIRKELGVYNYLPGITGLAQINRIDTSKPRKMAVADMMMLKKLNVINYFKFIFITVIGKGNGDMVRELDTSSKTTEKQEVKV